MRFRFAAMAAALSCVAFAPQQAAAQAVPYLSTIQWFGSNFCPVGWASAEGQLISIASNTALFSLLGTTYGGDGRTTFALPDLRGRSPLGVGQGPGLSNYTLGEQAGDRTVTLNAQNLPQHSHPASLTATLRASSANGDSADPSGRVLANGRTARVYNAPPANVAMDASSVTVQTSSSPQGAGQPFDNSQPYLGMIACIATQGIFPPRP
jgi:microcystin-dependent protein